MKRWLTLVLCSTMLVLIVYPSAFIYPKDTLPDNNDTRLIAYIIGQMQENITTGQPLYFGRFFAPDQNTLAYSDPFITTSLITLPIRLFTDNPITIFNLAYILNFSLTIICAFIFFNFLFNNLWITTLATVLFNFSGFHLHYYAHLQIFSLWMFFLSLYFFLKFQVEGKAKYLNLFLLTCTAQISESIFSFYLIFFATLFIFLQNPKQVKTILFHSLFFLPIWLILSFPYLKLQQTFPEATRPISDAAHFSLGLEQIFTFFRSRTVIFLFVFSIFLSKIVNAAGALANNRTQAGTRYSREIRVRFWRGPKRFVFDAWAFIFYFSLIMSLGPALKIFGETIKILGLPIPLPYVLFYYLFPGFQGFRTPSRFIVLALLAAVILIGYRLLPVFNKLKTKTKVIFLLLILSLLFTEADLPLKGYPVNINMHPVYEEVKNLPPNAAILELPVLLWNMPDHEIESIRSLYSLQHKHRRIGGFSGFATNDWIELVHKINTSGLNPENTTKLKSLGITHYIDKNMLYVLP